MDSRKCLTVSFCILFAFLCFVSALSDDSFVAKYIPTPAYHMGVHGYARRLSDISMCLGSLFTAITCAFYGIEKISNFTIISKLNSSAFEESKLGLNNKDVNRLRQKARKAERIAKCCKAIVLPAVQLECLDF